MAVYRGNKRPEPPSALPHATHQPPTATPSLRTNGSRAALSATRRSARKRTTIVMLSFLFAVVAGSAGLSYYVHTLVEDMKRQEGAQHPEQPAVQPKGMPKSVGEGGKSSSAINSDRCAFRSYPSNRLYGLSSKSPPKFLSEAAYIRGQWPIIINPIEDDGRATTSGKYGQQTAPVKVCVDTTSWENLSDKDGKERLPFTDGHNPSVVSLAPNPYAADANNPHTRLDPKYLDPIASAFPSDDIHSLFLGVTIFGGGQCKFGFSEEEVDAYNLSLHEEPQGGKRAVIAILAPPSSEHPFRTLAQTTLLLERDANYGKNRRAIKPETTDSGFARMHQEFDDPRLFFHLDRVWVLYRNGPLFGYTDQIHNPIHFEEAKDEKGNAKFVAYVKASETVRVGGGRNIALISEEPMGSNASGGMDWVSSPSLQALTWVDPVTVKDDIRFPEIEKKLQGRRLLEGSNADEPLPSPRHRRLGSKPAKSHIHGTNGYMVPLPSTGELLGIAHFHRPEDRKSSDFALHGHHYTHAFFTIAREGGDEEKDGRPFKLKRLSNEFVFRANSVPASEARAQVDADIIQFASGLDVFGSDVDGQAIISYGINDCEGGVFTLPMKKVQTMLMEVKPGQEVVDLMETQ
ncbi:hypothetical protein ACHAXT_009323 [Thalassiosira profunda]